MGVAEGCFIVLNYLALQGWALTSYKESYRATPKSGVMGPYLQLVGAPLVDTQSYLVYGVQPPILARYDWRMVSLDV